MPGLMMLRSSGKGCRLVGDVEEESARPYFYHIVVVEADLAIHCFAAYAGLGGLT
jgi:hypothetical protein